MDTKSVWEILFSLPVGTVLAWIAVITSIIGGFCTLAVKGYKIFTKYRNLQEKDAWQTEHIKKHDAAMENFSQSLDEIKQALEEQRNLNLKQLRHTIVNTCEDAIEKGEMSINKYRSLEEMFDEYNNTFHANSYAKSLVMKVRSNVKITGKTE